MDTVEDSNLLVRVGKDMQRIAEGAGVTNLELFAMELVDTANQRRHTDYKLVNILGRIAAADLERSRYEAHGVARWDTDFDSLAIDESKTEGALMFRLAENVSGIVVHERVKEAVERAGFALDFTEPKRWFG